MGENNQYDSHIFERVNKSVKKTGQIGQIVPNKRNIHGKCVYLHSLIKLFIIMKKYIFLLLLFCFWHTAVEACPYTIEHLSIGKGLSNNYVKDIIQDKQGFIWVATESGLNRFDGSGFTTYTTYDSSLSGNALNTLLYDKNCDRIWIGGQFEGLDFFDYSTGQISQCHSQHELTFENVVHLSLAADSGLWVTPHHSDILYYDTYHQTFSSLSDKGIKLESNSHWCTFDDGNGLLYIGHAQNGMTIVNLKSKSVRHFSNDPNDSTSLPGNSVYTIHKDYMGNIWVGTNQGLGLFNAKTNKFTVFRHQQENPYSLVADHIYDIKEMDNQMLWIATDIGGISILDLHSITLIDASNVSFYNITADNSTHGVSSNNIRSLLQDSFGNIWIGNYSSGINFISHTPNMFNVLPYLNNKGEHLKHKSVWGMYKDSQEQLWLGGENELALFQKNKLIKTFDISSYLSRPYGQIFSIIGNRQNILLLGIYDDGLLKFNTQSKHIERIPLDMKNIDIISFYQDLDESIWIGTEYGVYHYDDNMLHKKNNINQQLTDKSVYGILRDRQGKMWIGTYGGGIIVFDKKYQAIMRLNKSSGFGSSAINGLFMDSKGGIWVATRNGLAYIKDTAHPHKFEIYNHEQGLEDDFVRSIQEDEQGNIWLSTNNNIAYWNKATQLFENYDYRNGIPMGNFIEGSTCRGNDGILYFGSLNGVCFFQPKELTAKREVSPVKIVECRDLEKNDGNPIIPITNGTINLPYDRNSLRIYFSVPDYSQNKQVEYAYTMTGLENNWTSTQDESQVTFRNIPHGEYTFKIKARLRNHDWDNSHIATLKVHINPPIWMTWYAKIAYAIFIFAMIYIGIRIYMHRLILENSLKLSESKNRNEQELNNERLRFYTNITHELRTPLTLILGPLEDLINDPKLPNPYNLKIKIIHESALRLLNLINQILEFRKTETQNRKLTVVKGNLGNFITEIGLRYKELNRNTNVEVRVDIDTEIPEIYFDSDIITTILNNLLSNAMKYTQEGEIILALHTIEEGKNEYAEIKVSDTGHGIDAQALPHIFERYYQAKGKHQASGTGIGLALVKSLADLHEGILQVESEIGKGTTFTFRILTQSTYPNALHKEEKAITAANENAKETVDNLPIILIVEDNDDIRNYIATSFTGNYRTLTAENGKEGWIQAQKYIPDIIISDIMMPEMNGIELCKLIKEDMRTCHIPVILLTAKDSILDKEEGYQSGADSYLTKPFSAKLLSSRINNLLESRQKLASLITNRAKEIIPQELVEQDIIKLSKLDQDFLDRFTKIIEENITVEKLDINFMTDKMNMSHSTLYRKIKGLTGVSGNEFIRKIKLRHGLFLLTKERLNISEAAYASGFSDIGYFRKCFKEEYGATPSQYLKQL